MSRIRTDRVRHTKWKRFGSFWGRFTRMFGLSKINYAAAFLSGLIILLLLVYNAYATCARYFFDAPPQGATEISTFLIPVLVFLALAYTLQVERHIVVDVFIVLLKPRTQLILKAVTTVLIGIFAAILVWKGMQLSLIKLHEVSSSELRLPLFPFYISIPIGGLLLLFQSIKNIKGYIILIRAKGSEGKDL